MKWDLSLTKKFNSVNHSRLLKQLKAEVKAYPLKKNNDNKNLDNKKLNTFIKKDNQVNINKDSFHLQESLRENPQKSNLYKSKHDDNNTGRNQNTINQIDFNCNITNNDSFESNLESNIYKEKESFKDRLNNIEMR